VKILNLRIRKAVSPDSQALTELADELIHLDGWSNRDAMLKKSFQDPNCDIYVAEIDNVTIQNLIVKKNYRGLGIGSRLVERAVEETKDRNAIEIHVWTEFDNERAISFYTKRGFKKRALLLEKELDTDCSR